MPRLSPLAFRRLLRKNSTDAERELWGRLRARRTDRKFRRQHAVGPYILDFYCPSARLAVELDGGHHYGGEQAVRDLARDDWLKARGIRVLRYSDVDVLLEPEAVEDSIWLALEEIELARGS